LIECTAQGPVSVLTVNRPDKRNALNIDVCDTFRSTLQHALGNGARAIVITGAGTSFCSGADLDNVYTADFKNSLYGMLRSILDAPVPVVAAVNGPAFGAGTQLAIAADLRVAAPSAVFAIPTARLALAVDPWTIRRLVQLAGHGAASRLLQACDEINVSEALACGLADRPGELDTAVEWAQKMATLAPLTLAYNKRVLNCLSDPAVDEAALHAAFEGVWAGADLEEGRRARAEKRPPVFRGE
jgi:enoyl-CoA hydratase